MAHNVHPTDPELERLAAAGTVDRALSVQQRRARQRHLPAAAPPGGRRRIALGTDVGGGTGFGMLKEGLQAYLMQRLCRTGWRALVPAHLLYLATRAGAEALGLEDEIGDFSPARRADFVYLRPPARQRRSRQRWRSAESLERLLGGPVHAGRRGKRARGSGRGRVGRIS